MSHLTKLPDRTHFGLLIVALLLGALLSTLTEDYLRPKISNLFLQIRGVDHPVQGSSVLDEEGIPLYFIASNSQPQRHPVIIAHKALFDYWPTCEANSNEVACEPFIKIADWFVANAVEREGGFVVWEYTYSLPRVSPPWISTLSQSLGLIVLAHAHQVTGDPVYLEIAQLAVKSFSHDIADGGVRIKDDNGGWWYEHFAAPQARPSRTLNAMAYSLHGLWHYYEYSKDPLARELFEQGMVALKQHLAEYDAKVWSYYDADGTLANPHYHGANIHSLEALYEITADPLLLEYSQRWQGYANSRWAWVQREFTMERPFIVRRFYDTTPQKIDWTILLSTTVSVWVLLELGLGCIRLTKMWLVNGNFEQKK